MDTTIKAIKRVQEVRAKRERIHALNRLVPKQAMEQAEAIGQMQKNVALVSTGLQRKTDKVKVAKAETSRKMEID